MIEKVIPGQCIGMAKAVLNVKQLASCNGIPDAGQMMQGTAAVDKQINAHICTRQYRYQCTHVGLTRLQPKAIC